MDSSVNAGVADHSPCPGCPFFSRFIRRHEQAAMISMAAQRLPLGHMSSFRALTAVRESFLRQPSNDSGPVWFIDPACIQLRVNDVAQRRPRADFQSFSGRTNVGSMSCRLGGQRPFGENSSNEIPSCRQPGKRLKPALIFHLTKRVCLAVVRCSQSPGFS